MTCRVLVGILLFGQGSGTNRTRIGIHLGTTHACVGVTKRGKVEILTNEQTRTIPCYVSFGGDMDVKVGNPAKDEAAVNPNNTVFDAKRYVIFSFDLNLLHLSSFYLILFT